MWCELCFFDGPIQGMTILLVLNGNQEGHHHRTLGRIS
jgi:hypothetical protein